MINKGFLFKSGSLLLVVECFILFLLSSCTNHTINDKHHKVFIEEKDGKFTLIRNGKPYVIKGASGFTYLKKLNEIGGNTIRTYDSANIGSILDEAEANNVAVVVGLDMADNKNMNDFYDDTAKVRGQFRAYKKIIEKYKSHPAVLMWCVGNELDFKLNFKYNHFFNAYNNLVDMIHEADPDHPVTTTVIDVRRSNIYNIKLRTKTDVISINSFGGLRTLKNDLKDFSWFWKEPYLILEWGVKGPWRPNRDKTEWESYIESTSSKKAEQYLQIYKNELPVDDPRMLGSFVFYWGQKQEYTHTWYSMFYENGATSEAVGVMQYIWTGKWPAHTAPRINYMLVDRKGALDNIIYKPGKIANAELHMAKTDSSITSVKWELYHEDWYRKDNVKNLKKLTPIDSLFFDCKNLNATFSAPLQEGPYRLFATIFDKYGNFATCNTPFYVIK
ncbi:glycoside hydrolase family 2 TIM barrel-domain containing protein [Segetibacter koreensis]|uniref:glycoside hydrolase family 2 TIM barrel-domain containing protein n=1 Tax=Segetibacter koreensis TaxID=398037 RepID=UPI00036661DB|nr:glycoside hydrolase family 2 TIM barrel-domain containing protein [Segetibacter koreensis]